MKKHLRDKAKQRLGQRELVFGLSQIQGGRENWDIFRRLVDLAVECGATHIQVGNLPFRYGSWVLPDNKDPYASWCVHCPSILRTCPPPEIQEWVGLDEAERVREYIGRQIEIMRPFGLKATVSSIEPMWLPEAVYRAHPRWRGAQCELGRIALNPYFAPSIDEPEVLDLYHRAIREYCTLFPEIDEFEFMSNDSGAGIAWTPCIYPGMNGPVRYRTRDGGERISGWLNTLKKGAFEAGSTVRINMFSSGFPPELKSAARKNLEPGLFVSWANNHSEPFSMGGAGLGGCMWDPRWPVVGLADPVAFINGVQRIYANPENDSGRAKVTLYEANLDRARTLIECVLDEPETGLLSQTRIALAAAARFCGDNDACAEALVETWKQIQQAVHAFSQIRQKGFGLALSFCGVSMRWLLRPLVPSPEKLSPEEKSHYRDFIFAAGEAKDDPNFGIVLGKAVFNGESVTWMARWCLQEAIGTLGGARQHLQEIAGKLPEDSPKRRDIELMSSRVAALACLAANARNCIMYKYALDTAMHPMYGPNQVDYDDNIIYDQRALTLRKIAREELDNITELIERIEAHPHAVVVEHAIKEEEESVFMLPVELLAALRRKQEVMLDHWQDYETLFPATKVWDFEPAAPGNRVYSGPGSDAGVPEK